jgi:hypothetical protein
MRSGHGTIVVRDGEEANRRWSVAVYPEGAFDF